MKRITAPVIIGSILLTFGTMGLVTLINHLIRGDLSHVFTGPVFSLGFITLGIIIFQCHQKSYRLTTRTIVGALMLLFAALALASEIELLVLRDREISVVAALVVLLFMAGGFALLRHGHLRDGLKARKQSKK
jgi:multisubunit Na+/H+ antiporter MnhG subunit